MGALHEEEPSDQKDWLLPLCAPRRLCEFAFAWILGIPLHCAPGLQWAARFAARECAKVTPGSTKLVLRRFGAFALLDQMWNLFASTWMILSFLLNRRLLRPGLCQALDHAKKSEFSRTQQKLKFTGAGFGFRV